MACPAVVYTSAEALSARAGVKRRAAASARSVVRAPAERPSAPPAVSSPCHAPVLVMMWTTPPSASGPQTAAAGPRSTSTRSISASGIGRSLRKWPVIGSLKRAPSMRKRTPLKVEPRSVTSACVPAPPRGTTATPASLRSSSSSERDELRAMSAAVMTVTWRPVRRASSGMRLAVTTAPWRVSAGAWACAAPVSRTSRTAGRSIERARVSPEDRAVPQLARPSRAPTVPFRKRTSASSSGVGG